MESEILEVLNEIRDLTKRHTRIYGMKNEHGWLIDKDGIPISGALPVILATIEGFQTGFSGQLADTKAVLLPGQE